jgi:HD superfamily phosphodiesterase
MDDSKFQQAAQYAMDLMRREILPAFTYHNAAHTLAVVNACNRLAELEGIDEESLRLLLLAAYFHDTGLTSISSTDPDVFQSGRAVHEERSVQIARNFLSDCDLGEQEMEVIARLIMATKLGHIPTDRLEQIISDADMSSLGQVTETFMVSSEALLQELRSFGVETGDNIEWYKSQKQLLKTYAYHTPAARTLFDENRLLNLAAVQSHLSALHS